MEVGDADEAEDAAPFRLPPPPDDRLWRHPSELGGPASTRRTPWGLVLVSAVSGAVLAVGVIATAGMLGAVDDPGEVIIRPALDTSGVEADDDVVRAVEATAPALVRFSRGDGVVYRHDGHVLTTVAAIGQAATVAVTLADGRRVTAHVVGADEPSGIAVVKLESARPFRAALLGTVDALAAGDLAIALAAPRTVVTARFRGIGGDERDVVQTDTVMPAGVLLDRHGAVVAIVADRGLAVPVDVARAVADELVQVGRVRTCWVGVRGQSEDDGVHVVNVLDGSPAGSAGLRAGDVLRRVDGRVVTSMTAVRLTLQRHRPGDRIVLAYDRAGARRRAVLTLAERPS